MEFQMLKKWNFVQIVTIHDDIHIAKNVQKVGMVVQS